MTNTPIKKDTVILSQWSGSSLCTASAAPPSSPAPSPFASSPVPCPTASDLHSLQSEPNLRMEDSDTQREYNEVFLTQTVYTSATKFHSLPFGFMCPWKCTRWCKRNKRAVCLPFKICVTIFAVSVCWSKRAWCSSFSPFSLSGWLLLMNPTKASPVSSKSWNLWPWAIVGS